VVELPKPPWYRRFGVVFLAANLVVAAVRPDLDQYPSDHAPGAVKLEVMPWCAGVWVAGI
jgi:hypothetical protein